MASRSGLRVAPLRWLPTSSAGRAPTGQLVVLGAATFDVLLTAADERKLSYAECAPLMIDYIAPSLDTTISSISSALYLFATHPEQWQILKDDPSLIANAVNEMVRAQQHHPSP